MQPRGKLGDMIRLSKSCLSQAEKKAVIGVLNRGYLGMGAEVQMFEKRLSSFFGRPAICVASGTAALQLAMEAIGLKDGDEVLVPSLTYVASFQAISATGAIPVACDVEDSTLILDWRDAELRITERTKAIMTVHYSGGVGDLEGIYALAEKHGLRVIEDAAHAFGTKHKNKLIGSFGDIVCFSFDGIKNITSGEGGCVLANNDIERQKIKDTRLLGVEKDTEMRYSGQRSWEFNVTSQGWRYHMSNIMAAIGIEQLNRFDKMQKKRKNLAKEYDRLIGIDPRVVRIKHDYDEVVPHIYTLRIIDSIDKKLIQKKLLESDIQTGVHYQPNHKLSYYFEETALPFTNVEKAYKELITLPLHPEMTKKNIKVICDSLRKYLNESQEVNKNL